MVLGDVEETVYIVEEDENGEETIKVCRLIAEGAVPDGSMLTAGLDGEETGGNAICPR